MVCIANKKYVEFIGYNNKEISDIISINSLGEWSLEYTSNLPITIPVRINGKRISATQVNNFNISFPDYNVWTCTQSWLGGTRSGGAGISSNINIHTSYIYFNIYSQGMEAYAPNSVNMYSCSGVPRNGRIQHTYSGGLPAPRLDVYKIEGNQNFQNLRVRATLLAIDDRNTPLNFLGVPTQEDTYIKYIVNIPAQWSDDWVSRLKLLKIKFLAEKYEQAVCPIIPRDNSNYNLGNIAVFNNIYNSSVSLTNWTAIITATEKYNYLNDCKKPVWARADSDVASADGFNIYVNLRTGSQTLCATGYSSKGGAHGAVAAFLKGGESLVFSCSQDGRSIKTVSTYPLVYLYA